LTSQSFQFDSFSKAEVQSLHCLLSQKQSAQYTHNINDLFSDQSAIQYTQLGELHEEEYQQHSSPKKLPVAMTFEPYQTPFEDRKQLPNLETSSFLHKAQSKRMNTLEDYLRADNGFP
jgi:hypothetical protein